MDRFVRPVCKAFAFALISLHVAAASATVLWHGNFENGTRAEFGRYHAVQATPPRINVLPKPTADGLDTAGNLAARVEVDTGDEATKLDPTTGEQIGTNQYHERAELQVPNTILGHTYFREGDDVWMTWQTMFPKNEWWGLDPKGGGTIFFQIHHVKISDDTYDGSPPLMFIADNDNLYVRQCLTYPCSSSTVRYQAPLDYGHWYTFVLHAKHSTDPAKGQLQVWIDGQQKIDQHVALLYGSDFGNYVLTGQYRRPNTIHNGVLWADNYVLGTTQADVMSSSGAPIASTTPPTSTTSSTPPPSTATPEPASTTDNPATEPTSTAPSSPDTGTAPPTSTTDSTTTTTTTTTPTTTSTPAATIAGSGGGQTAAGCSSAGSPMGLALLVAGAALALQRKRRQS